jgi:hypothetical protein
MQSRRFILDGLEEANRREFAGAALGRFIDALRLEFRSEAGFACIWDDQDGVLRISRGNFWGLEVSLEAGDSACKIWEWKLKAFFPVVRRVMQPIERAIEWKPRPAAVRIFWGHLLVPLYLFPLLFALPFMAGYRIALLALEKDVSSAARRLDLFWPSVQARWPGQPPELQRRSPLLAFSVASAATALSAALCFHVAALPGTSDKMGTALIIAGVVFSVISLVFLIGLILGALGFGPSR